MKKTKIICSIGPSSCPPDTMEKMVNAGMNVARINFSHATLEEKQGVVASVHEVRKRTGKNIAILYDTKGPEFRSGETLNGEIKLEEGKTIKVVKENIKGTEEAFSVNHPQALDSLEVGSTILLENGLMKIEVISIDNDKKGNRTGVTCKIINGGVLGDRKSLNAPGVKLDIPFISEQDEEDLIYACEHEADFIALSFVSCAQDVLDAKALAKKHGREDIQMIAKIESSTGIDNLDEILEVSEGVMVARGDLGVEMPMQKLPIYQKLIIQKAREYGKFCIVATEMLESMKKSSRPTRAEISDVANAVLDGTDAVMLSGETTLGKYPVETVEYMAEICETAEESYDYEYQFDSVRKIDIPETIAKSVVDCAELLDVKCIVAATISGYSAKKISNLKPNATILAACPTEKTARSLALCWGVYPIFVPEYDSTDEVVNESREKAKEFLKLKKDDLIVITGGFPNNTKVKTTNFLKIEKIK